MLGFAKSLLALGGAWWHMLLPCISLGLLSAVVASAFFGLSPVLLPIAAVFGVLMTLVFSHLSMPMKLFNQDGDLTHSAQQSPIFSYIVFAAVVLGFCVSLNAYLGLIPWWLVVALPMVAQVGIALCVGLLVAALPMVLMPMVMDCLVRDKGKQKKTGEREGNLYATPPKTKQPFLVLSHKRSGKKARAVPIKPGDDVDAIKTALLALYKQDDQPERDGFQEGDSFEWSNVNLDVRLNTADINMSQAAAGYYRHVDGDPVHNTARRASVVIFDNQAFVKEVGGFAAGNSSSDRLGSVFSPSKQSKVDTSSDSDDSDQVKGLLHQANSAWVEV